MGRISFTANLERHLPRPTMPARGDTVREVLEHVFAENPPLRSYLLDDQGGLRRHVNSFINDRAVADRAHLSDPVAPEDEIYVFQALSGG